MLGCDEREKKRNEKTTGTTTTDGQAMDPPHGGSGARSWAQRASQGDRQHGRRPLHMLAAVVARRTGAEPRAGDGAGNYYTRASNIHPKIKWAQCARVYGGGVDAPPRINLNERRKKVILDVQAPGKSTVVSVKPPFDKCRR